MLFKKAPVFLLLLLLCGISTNCFSASTSDGDASIHVIGRRNIFRPLWNISPAATVQQPAASAKLPSKKDETDLKLAEQAARKKEIEAGFVFSGIIFERNEPEAVVQSKTTGKSYVVKKGDTIEEMKVISIDPASGELLLEHKEFSTLSFRLQ